MPTVASVRVLREAIDEAKRSALPGGGHWVTSRGARIYIHGGKIHAGAGGKLTGSDARSEHPQTKGWGDVMAGAADRAAEPKSAGGGAAGKPEKAAKKPTATRKLPKRAEAELDKLPPKHRKRIRDAYQSGNQGDLSKFLAAAGEVAAGTVQTLKALLVAPAQVASGQEPT